MALSLSLFWFLRCLTWGGRSSGRWHFNGGPKTLGHPLVSIINTKLQDARIFKKLLLLVVDNKESQMVLDAEAGGAENDI